MESASIINRKALVIYSPHAGRSRQLPRVLSRLSQIGVEVAGALPITTFAQDNAQKLSWNRDGINVLVAAGGDGLIGGLVPYAIEYDLPLGILPLGTANDVARSIGIPQNLFAAAEVIATGTYRTIGVGAACPLSQKGAVAVSNTTATPASHAIHQQGLFAHALTVGLSVQFSRMATNKAIRQRYGHLTYPLSLWHAFRTYRPIEAELHFEGVAIRTTPSARPVATDERLVLRTRIAQATAVNAPIFWGSFEGAVPGVSLDDHFLDMVVFEDTSRPMLALRMLHFFKRPYQQSPGKRGWHAHYPKLLPVQRTDVPGVHHIRARSLTIFTDSEQHAVTLDGEVCASTPIEAHVAEQRLRLIVPHISPD
jgi:diacylglycerol kinase (ATP)